MRKGTRSLAFSRFIIRKTRLISSPSASYLKQLLPLNALPRPLHACHLANLCKLRSFLAADHSVSYHFLSSIISWYLVYHTTCIQAPSEFPSVTPSLIICFTTHILQPFQGRTRPHWIDTYIYRHWEVPGISRFQIANLSSDWADSAFRCVR